MALKARITEAQFAALPDAIKAEYRQEGDIYLIDVVATDGWDLQDIRGLTSTLAKVKREATEAKAALKAFEVDGEQVDPAEAVAALAKLKKLGNLDPEQLAQEKVKVALAQQQDQFNKQIAAKDGEAQALLKNLETVLVDQAATAALASKGGNIKLLLPHVKSNAKVVKEGDKFKVQIVDADGNPRIQVAGGRTADMTLEELVDEMAGSDDYASAFEAKSKPGAGTPTNINGNGAGNGRVRVVAANDQNTLNNSLEALAKGQATVQFAD